MLPLKDAELSYNRNPERPWCEGKVSALCLQSRYKLEGKLPIGIMLLNKLRDSDKKVADFIEFQSELRALAPADVDDATLKRVDRDRHAGHRRARAEYFLRQPDHAVRPLRRGVPAASCRSRRRPSSTAFIVLAVESDLLEKKKEYENVPVLRNLVPAQVLSGNSSFNTGNSISAGLPVYARNRIKAIADILENDRGSAALK